MNEIKQAISVAIYNFRQWNKNPRIIVTFCLSFIMCFLLSDKVVTFAIEHNSPMQIAEAFIWSFEDSNSILLSSSLLILLFADMPFLSSGTPFYLVRTQRSTWIIGQLIYTLAATTIYVVFTLASTALLCMKQSYIANMWSPTAAILGYTSAGKRINIPSLIKTLELSWPYQTMVATFFLILGYALVLVMLMLFFNLWKGQATGVISVFIFSIYGFLLKPDTIQTIFRLPDEAFYKANVAIGWLSPLNHATFHMHNFGYDLLPRLWQSYIIFLFLVLVGCYASIQAIEHYNFNFTGTEG